MENESTSRKPTTRRYTPEEKAQAVRLVRQLRKELGTSQGTVKRVADLTAAIWHNETTNQPGPARSLTAYDH